MKKTISEFIYQAKDIHGDRYDYSLVEYKNTKNKVKIICNIHGIFEQSPQSHLSGQGCSICGFEKTKNNNTKNTKEFINQAKNKQDDKYDYSLVNYINAYTKVKIMCKEHGLFEQTPNSHLSGTGCPICNNNNSDTNTFINKSLIKNGNRYDYSLVNYINSKTKIKIICKEHGIYNQSPNSHLSGTGCPECNKKTTETFILKAKEIHDDKYDYSVVNYINNSTKVKIMCKEHGLFEQLPSNHLSNNGCPKCRKSKGENKISIFLNKYNIKFEEQKMFADCKFKSPLKFDFYLSDYNICIEYDGEFHFLEIDQYGGIKKLEYQQNNDNIKNEYCKKNKIKLLRINYKQNIKTELIYFLNQENIIT